MLISCESEENLEEEESDQNCVLKVHAVNLSPVDFCIITHFFGLAFFIHVIKAFFNYSLNMLFLFLKTVFILCVIAVA